MILQEYDPDSTDAIVNAESDTSTVCQDSVDTCVSPVLKVSFLYFILCIVVLQVTVQSLFEEPVPINTDSGAMECGGAEIEVSLCVYLFCK